MKDTLNIQDFLERYYQNNDSVILACSWGPDSMYLLYKILETSFSKNLVICYFNHKTRAQTDEEEAYLEKLAAEKWCLFESAECDFEKIQQLYPSKSFEELAREKRYQFFDAIMNIYNAKYVITAHHLDDRIETCMFNMLRGSKLTGLINMTECHGWILRPLLSIEKTQILEYLENNTIHYFQDETNMNTDVTRNRIRHEIMPKLAKVHPNHKWNIQNLLQYFEEIKEHIDSQITSFVAWEDFFYIKEFNALSPLIQKETIRYLFHTRNGWSTIWLSENNIAEIIRFINGKNNKTIKEIKNLKMEKDNLVIRF